MNKAKKILALVCCAALLVCISVGATLAYLLDKSDNVVNTFTVGNVVIDLDEAEVDEYGNYVTDHENRVKANTYKLLPGHTYIKDPTVTVEEKSEDAYVRIKVSVSDMAKLKAAFPADKYPTFYAGDLFLLQMLVEGWSNDVWQYVAVDANGAYEFRYVGPKATAGVVPYSTQDTVLEDLFTHVVIPGDIDHAGLENLNNVTINIIAHAIQSDGFEDNIDRAWAAFDAQPKD